MTLTNTQEKIQTNDALNRVGPCVLVIFGASGDLTKRKLIPALYNLASAGLLPDDFAVVGLGRKELTSGKFREQLSGDLCQFVDCELNKPELKEWVSQRLYYLKGEYDNPESYAHLKNTLQQIDNDHNSQGNYLFYLATPPSLFGKIVEQLSEAGLTHQENNQWRRVIIEKPFGRDFESARDLNRELQKFLDESQIYRIDHYLGKETVQNILVFRFANGIFEPIWNRRYVDHVQITVSEELGVEHRASFYEEAGALRDMVSNHTMQLLSYIAMEPPNSFDAEAVRNEKAKVLHAIHPYSHEDVLSCTVRGQYGEGVLANGESVPEYRSEPNVNPESKTETFVALKMMIDNWRWADVPFYIRTGKRMPKRTTEIAIYFKKPPFTLFRETPVENLETNVLVIRIQPNEGISLSFGAKIPGAMLDIGTMKMDFNYSDYFGNKKAAIGYETLLHDCMTGDATLFSSADNVECAWGTLTTILDVWGTLPVRDFPNYASGSWGPEDANKLLAKDGRQWRNDT